jgi:type IV secretory pathway ATPase VirB11/archaellum biosynthesis ATPase
MRNPLARFREDDPECRCEPTAERGRLLLDATHCPGGGDLAAEPACRATAVGALAARESAAVVTRTDSLERAYEDGAAALLVAAGRFADRVAFYDDRLAERTLRDPLGAARAATGRAGPVGELVAETGLAECARRVRSTRRAECVRKPEGDYADAIRAFVGPAIAKARVAARPPPDATLVETRRLATDATVRLYEDDRALRTYHLEPVEHTFDAEALAVLAEAHELLAEGEVGNAEGTAADGDLADGDRGPGRAVRLVAGPDQPVEALARVLRKHTRGYGVLADFFADPAVADVFATAPVGENPLRVTADGERFRTNVRLTAAGAQTLASRFRRESGRAFSRAAPTLDATAETAAGTVRVAGVTDPVSDGPGFAFRTHDATPWTLPALVANGTLPAEAAALLSVAVERAAAGLVAGPRGAGKTTLLGALCWELPAETRTVVIEDTPELPVPALQSRGRDVQPLRTESGDGPGLEPPDALRAALRLGEGAIVVGEVRGEEAAVLYEAMRVGASGDAVLGTIHGDGGEGVRERVVSDLGVPASSFATTDLVVTLEATEGLEGRRRRVKAIEEVVDGDRFESLFEIERGTDGFDPTGNDALETTGRIDRGNSVLVASLAEAGESYAAVREVLADRETLLAELARRGRTAPDEVVSAYAGTTDADGRGA